jgi:site-specific recombinase XerD
MNNNPCPFLFDESEYQNLCRDFVESRHQLHTSKTRADYYSSLRLFRRWMIKNEHTELNEKIVKAWMLDCTQRKTVDTIGTEVGVVANFLDYLVSRKLWCENPLSTLRLQHRNRGYLGMVRVLKKTGSIAALDKLAETPLSGALASHFTDYFDYIGALGKSLEPQGSYLKSFERYLRQHNIHDLKQIDASVVAAWNDWLGQASEQQQRRRMAGLKKFFDFLLGQERVRVSPIHLPPHRRNLLPPYIFSREEMKSILAAAEKLPDHRFMPYRGPTYRMVFLSLYTLGLRINEALSLKLADIDFVQDSVTIRDTKFYKGRVLPFGPRFKAALQGYINGHPLLIRASAEDFLFPTQYYQFDRTPRLSRTSCYHTLRRILKEMSVTPPPATLSLRLHSFRHSFAVHRLENWMREGADVGAKLPLLSAFLGHITVAHTQAYLTLTPERLAMLGERFENAFGILPQAEEVRS